jgi:putative endonuclease
MLKRLIAQLAPNAWRKPLGVRGESLAAEYLSRRGYKVLMRNYRTNRGEIDLVARLGDLLVFCEVKTRSGSKHAPHRQVTHQKQQRIRRAARSYLSHYATRPACRFDVISIVWSDDDQPKIEHLTNAFGP